MFGTDRRAVAWTHVDPEYTAVRSNHWSFHSATGTCVQWLRLRDTACPHTGPPQTVPLPLLAGWDMDSCDCQNKWKRRWAGSQKGPFGSFIPHDVPAPVVATSVVILLTLGAP